MKKRLLSLLLAACLLLGMGVSALADGAAGDIAPSDETPVPEVTEELLPPAEEAETETTPAPETPEEPLPPAEEAETEPAPAPETTEEPLPPAEEAETETAPAPETTEEPLPPAEEAETEITPVPETTEEPLPPADGEGPADAEAEGENAPTPEEAAEPAMEYAGYTYINPLYADEITEADLVRPADTDAANAAEAPVFSTVQEAAVYMRQQAAQRIGTVEFTIPFLAGVKDDLNAAAESIWDIAVAHTGKPREGDYIRWQYGGLRVNYRYYPVDDGFRNITYTYTLTYYTTAAQEAEMDSAVASTLSSLSLAGKNDAQKVRAIYDFICSNITYDYKNLNDKTYMLKHTAYAALIHRTSVCQGYAVLLYRMLLECGIDCRVVTGIGGGGNHAWNIVGLYGLYYNADSTWDAPPPRYGYDYYLVCDAHFPDHSPDSDYTTASWRAAYPMSTTDYKEGSEPPAAGTVPGTDLGWAVHGNTLTIDGGGAVPDLSTGAPWSYYATQLHSIVLSAGVDSVTPGAFSACTALESVRVENPHCQILPLFPNTFANADIAGYRYSSAHNYADAHGRTFTAIGCLGDVTGGDGETTGADLDALFSAVKSAGTLDRTTADVSGDGAVDLKDVTGLYQHLNGARPYFD